MGGRSKLLNYQGLAAAVEATSTGVVIADAMRSDSPIVYANSTFETITGYSSDEIVGRNCRFLQGPGTSKAAVAELHMAIQDGRHITLRLLNYRKDGSAFWNELTINPIHDDGAALVGFVGVQKDVTAEVAMRRELAQKVEALEAARLTLETANRELQHIAYVDTLTGLPTRRLFFDRLTQALARSKRTNEMLAVAFLDLDGFKAINDSFGHEAGDLALFRVGERLRSQLRETDTLARLGGDEYILLIDADVTHELVADIWGRISAAFLEPFDLGSATAQLGVSIGTALYPHDGDDASALMRAADFAMYETKNEKRQLLPADAVEGEVWRI